jgi:hypothetical protein
MSGYLQGRGIHVDRHLSQIAINYRPTGMIADRIMPIITVDKQTNMIKTYNQADLFRIEDTLRSPGTEANKIHFQVGSDNYVCDNYALKADVTIEDRANADPAFIRDLEGGRVMNVKDKLALGWEKRISDLATNSTNVSTVTFTASSWTDHTNSSPYDDINAVIDLVHDATGYRPIRMVASELPWRHISRNEEIIDKVNKTGVTGGDMNARVQQVAELFELEEVLVGRAFYNSADEGQSLSLTRMWGDNVLLYFNPPRASNDVPAWGYSFRWRQGGLPNMQVERHPFDTRRKVDELEIGYYQDEKVTSSALAVLISYTTSSQ